jgi:hypothetical protein
MPNPRSLVFTIGFSAESACRGQGTETNAKPMQNHLTRPICLAKRIWGTKLFSFPNAARIDVLPSIMR